VISSALRKAHERLVDNPPWIYIVHDLNPRAMSPKGQGVRLAAIMVHRFNAGQHVTKETMHLMQGRSTRKRKSSAR